MAGSRDRADFTVPASEIGERLDRTAATAFDLTRSAAQRHVSNGHIKLDGEVASPSFKLRGGEVISAEIPSTELVAEDIPVEVVYEDDDVVVVNKPAGLIVHPGAGNPSGTLVNALLGRGICGGEDPVRPGIVHRLDRDTSGLMMVSKTQASYETLVGQLSRREVGRTYRTVVEGAGLPATGTIDSPVGRDPENPTLMAAGIGKHAVTHFETLAGSRSHTMLRVNLETGRTHQIRVHLSAIEFPVHADPLYGKAVPGERLWLHAERLQFVHPKSAEEISFEAEIPEDLRAAARHIGFDAEDMR